VYTKHFSILPLQRAYCVNYSRVKIIPIKKYVLFSKGEFGNCVKVTKVR
jgi:hypothetical protein